MQGCLRKGHKVEVDDDKTRIVVPFLGRLCGKGSGSGIWRAIKTRNCNSASLVNNNEFVSLGKGEDVVTYGYKFCSV